MTSPVAPLVLCTLHCFVVDATIKVSWRDAEAKCQASGGVLASIENVDQNRNIEKIINTKVRSEKLDGQWHQFWIGGKLLGSHRGRGSNWQWTDGTTWRFIRWNLNEPNNQNGHKETEGCVAFEWIGGGLDNDRWGDYPCSQLKPYICKVPL